MGCVDVILRNTQEVASTFGFLAWSLWHNRNSLVFAGKSTEPLVISSLVLSSSHLYRSANSRSNMTPVVRPAISWLPPPCGKFKLNFDAAIFNDLKCCGVGVVIRDYIGIFLAAMAEKIQFVVEADLAEMLTARSAVEFGVELNLSGFLLEGDVQPIINKLKSSEIDFSSLGPIANDTKALINQFQVTNVDLVGREK
ncbi:hypothetical protein ACH5RR_013294 [Cinchona calisaya]|uniref:RNase H type-1 domain-containing protein n=1 Tax=Cinchona calisaya TaxID=153742 RepID=A0ABD2ZZR0_9GENT